ncbi:hypothetical protein FOZ62_022371, partial [Perkinsus olseni]
ALNLKAQFLMDLNARDFPKALETARERKEEGCRRYGASELMAISGWEVDGPGGDLFSIGSGP